MSLGVGMVSNLSRRALLGGIAALAAPLPAWADDAFRIDWQGGAQAPEVAASLAAQIALVEALRISDDAMEFFRSQVITVDRQPGTRTRAGPHGVFFERRAVPLDNPVLLHELIHRWQLARMGGPRDPDVVRFYDEARRDRIFPPNAYLMTNPFEFFAMAASTVLHGRAARPPFTRENVKAKMPGLYRFIVREFGFREA